MPDHWRSTTLGDVADVEMGQSPPGHTYNDEGIGLPFLQGSAEFGERFPVPDRWCSVPTRIAEPGDLLVSVRAPVGDTNFAHAQIAFGRGLARVRSTADASAGHLCLVIQSELDRLNQRAGGGMFASITAKNLRGFPVQIPTLVEQGRIVDVLGSIDDVTAAMEAQIAATRTLRGGVLAEMLGTPGPDWTHTTLGEVAEVRMGQQLSPIRRAGVRPRRYLRAANLTKEGIDMGDVLEMDFSEEEEEKFSLSVGDVLLVEGGNGQSVGCPALIGTREAGLCIQNTLLRCRVLEPASLLPEFLYQCLRSHFMAKEFAVVANGTTILHLGQRRAAGFAIAVPPIEEQRRIVEVVGAMDEQVTALEQQAAATRRVRAGVLSELLSGKRLLDESYDRAMGL